MKSNRQAKLALLTLMVAVFATFALPATGAVPHSARRVRLKRASVSKVNSSKTQVTVTTVAPTTGTTVSGTIAWQAKVSGATPSRVDFSLDGVVQASSSTSPFTYSGGLNTTSLSNGPHTLTVTAYARKSKLGSSTATVTVQNQAPAGLPAPEVPAPEEPAPAPQPEPEQPVATPSSIYWGAWIGSQLTGEQAPWDMSAVTKFEEMTGKPLSLIHFAAPFANCSSSRCSFYKFPTNPMESVRNHGSIPFFSWSSQSIPSSTNEPNFQLSDVISGAFDSYIREFATAAKNWGHPFFLRFDWEMNGNWFPWSEGVNGNKAGEYVAAWRHVHNIFTEVGATNATWVWCPNVDPENKFHSLSSLYPGNEYVNWTGLDGYNWGTNPAKPDRWRTFGELFRSTYSQIAETIAPSKPMTIGEMGSTEYGGSKAAWIKEALSQVPVSYPKIRALLYFEATDEGMDWPIESSPSATAAFAEGIGNPAYATNTFSSLSAGPVQPAS